MPEDGLAEVVAEPCEAAFDGAFGGSGGGGDGGEGTAVGVAVVEEGAVGIGEVGDGELEGGLPNGFGVFWRSGVWRGEESGESGEEGGVAAGASGFVGGGGSAGSGEPCPEGGFVGEGAEGAEGFEEGVLDGICGDGFVAAGDDESVAGEAVVVECVEGSDGGFVAAADG